MRQLLPFLLKPEDLLSIAAPFADEEGTALLYSGGSLDSASRSLLFLFPEEKISISSGSTCWKELKESLRLDSSYPEWVGYLSYEMGLFTDKEKNVAGYSTTVPMACFYRAGCVISLEHQTGIATVFFRGEKPPLFQREDFCSETNALKLSYRSDTYESYYAKILQAQEWIRAGEIYQVNLSQEFHFAGQTQPWNYFRESVRRNPAPFSAYLRLKECAIISSSPERLLRKHGSTLETRPIKGTSPRGKTIHEDLVLRATLEKSEKERAELLMITDLMRNDLGKLAAPNTVDVKEIWRIETYTNVFHLVSVVEATLMHPLHPIDILKEVFPGGSITGCPKLRAMEAISSLEERPRGIYTGSIGYFEGENFDFNIAIRTLVAYPDWVQLQVGGAIVIDSDPLREYEETLHKGSTLFKVLGCVENPHL